MIEIVLLAAVAVFVLFRLFSVLGKQEGAPPPEFRNPETGKRPQPVLVHSEADEPEEEDEASDLQKIAMADPQFSQREFLKGAKAAYEMIVTAFAEGDRETLKNLLNSDVYGDYDQALKDRETSGDEPNEFMRLKDANIDSAELTGSVAEISVLFEAELSNGEWVSQTRELWTFERDLKSRDPNWRLSDVSEG